MQLLLAQAHHSLQESTQARTRQQYWPVPTGPADPLSLAPFISAFSRPQESCHDVSEQPITRNTDDSDHA
jgi:hypothetical protein